MEIPLEERLACIPAIGGIFSGYELIFRLHGKGYADGMIGFYVWTDFPDTLKKFAQMQTIEPREEFIVLEIVPNAQKRIWVKVLMLGEERIFWFEA